MFARILREMVVSVPGGIGALFLDWEGETVALLSERPFELADDDLKIIGAYQGIFLTQLRALCGRIGAGAPSRFKLEYASARIFSCELPDGYFIVLVGDATTKEATAWQAMLRCRSELIAEM